MFDPSEFKRQDFLKKSLLTEKQQNPDLFNISPQDIDYLEYCRLFNIATNVEKFVNSGSNLYLYSSNVGNGKTTWAIKILLSYIKIAPWGADRVAGLFISVPRYFAEYKKNIQEYSEYFNTIKKFVNEADIVIWDDLSAYTRNSDFELDNFKTILDVRLDKNKSNIFTSNLTPRELTKAIGQRLSSRICNNSSIIEFKGPDKRKPKVEW